MKQEYIYIFFISVIAIFAIYYLFNITENFQVSEEVSCSDAFKDVYDRESGSCDQRIVKAIQYSGQDGVRWSGSRYTPYIKPNPNDPSAYKDPSPCEHESSKGNEYATASGRPQRIEILNSLGDEIKQIANSCVDAVSTTEIKSSLLATSCEDAIKSNIDTLNEQDPFRSCTDKVLDAMKRSTSECDNFNNDSQAKSFYKIASFEPDKLNFEKYCNDTYQQKAITEACKTKIKEKIDNKIGKNPYGICEDYFTNSLRDSKDDPECNYTDSNVDFIDGETEGYFYDTKQGMIQGCGSTSDTKKESCRTALETRIQEQSRTSTVESRELKLNGDLSINCANIYNPLGFNASAGQIPDCAGYDRDVYSTVNFTSMIDEFKTAGICENEPYQDTSTPTTTSAPMITTTSAPIITTTSTPGSGTPTTSGNGAPTTSGSGSGTPEVRYVPASGVKGDNSTGIPSSPEEFLKYLQDMQSYYQQQSQTSQAQFNKLTEKERQTRMQLSQLYPDHLRSIVENIEDQELKNKLEAELQNNDLKNVIQQIITKLEEEENERLRILAILAAKQKKLAEQANNLTKKIEETAKNASKAGSAANELRNATQ